MDNIYNGVERRSPIDCPYKDSIKDLKHIVCGNGQEGIQTRVIRIEEKLDNFLRTRPKVLSILSTIGTFGILIWVIVEKIMEG